MAARLSHGAPKNHTSPSQAQACQTVDLTTSQSPSPEPPPSSSSDPSPADQVFDLTADDDDTPSDGLQQPGQQIPGSAGPPPRKLPPSLAYAPRRRPAAAGAASASTQAQPQPYNLVGPSGGMGSAGVTVSDTARPPLGMPQSGSQRPRILPASFGGPHSGAGRDFGNGSRGGGGSSSSGDQLRALLARPTPSGGMSSYPQPPLSIAGHSGGLGSSFGAPLASPYALAFSQVRLLLGWHS